MSVSQAHVNDLPEEMVIRIFHMLPPRDLKSVMLVCKLWMEMGDADPTLWTWSLVTVNTRDDLQKLNIDRLQLIQKIEVGGCDHWWPLYNQQQHECIWKPCDLMELFRAMLAIPTLTRISDIDTDFMCPDLTSVDPHLLASVFNRLEELHLYHQLTSQQMEHLFTAIAKKETNLKVLELENVSELSPALFASAVSNVDEVMLMDQDITPQQLKALFAAITEDQRPLRKMDFISCNLHTIEPEVLGAAFNRLEDVTTANTWVSKEQVAAIIMKLVEGESKLKKMMLRDLTFNEFGGLDPDLLSQARGKIGEFYSEYDSEFAYEEEEDGDEYDEELRRLMDINVGD